MRGKVIKLNGIASVVYDQGSDGTAALYLRDGLEPKRPSKLTGFGHDQRSAAMHLVEQLRLYADWIAALHDLEVRDQATLDAKVEMMTGRKPEWP